MTVTGVEVPLGHRSISARQLLANTQSLTGGSANKGLEGTITWRLDYWGVVLDDVLLGDDWIAGIGYGPNLADRYGFQVVRETSQPLRNAHNSHVTLIARLGVIGLILWVLFWIHFAVLSLRSRRSPDSAWFGWLVALASGIAVTAIFDPILEGPQVAIPFWVVVGLLGGNAVRRNLARLREAS